MNYANRIKFFRRCEGGEKIMRDVLFRYENNSTNTDGVYFDMDGNGIQEKMLTWTDPNEWMVANHLIVESNNTRKAA